MLGELYRKTPEGRPVEAGEKPLYDALRHDLEASQLGDFVRVEQIDPASAGHRVGNVVGLLGPCKLSPQRDTPPYVRNMVSLFVPTI
jgi:hypothetical protein